MGKGMLQDGKAGGGGGQVGRVDRQGRGQGRGDCNGDGAKGKGGGGGRRGGGISHMDVMVCLGGHRL